MGNMYGRIEGAQNGHGDVEDGGGGGGHGSGGGGGRGGGGSGGGGGGRGGEGGGGGGGSAGRGRGGGGEGGGGGHGRGGGGRGRGGGGRGGDGGGGRGRDGGGGEGGGSGNGGGGGEEGGGDGDRRVTIDILAAVQPGPGPRQEDMQRLKPFTNFGSWMAGLSFAVLFGIVSGVLSTDLKEKGGAIRTLLKLCCAILMGMFCCSVSMLLVIYTPSASGIDRKVEILKGMLITTLLSIIPVAVLGFILLLLILKP